MPFDVNLDQRNVHEAEAVKRPGGDGLRPGVGESMLQRGRGIVLYAGLIHRDLEVCFPLVARERHAMQSHVILAAKPSFQDPAACGIGFEHLYRAAQALELVGIYTAVAADIDYVLPRPHDAIQDRHLRFQGPPRPAVPELRRDLYPAGKCVPYARPEEGLHHASLSNISDTRDRAALNE